MDVRRAAEREADHAGGDRLVGEAVDQDDAARVAVLRIGVEGDRLGGRQIDHADLVQLQHLGSVVLKRVDIEAVFEIGHLRGNRARHRLQEILAAGQHVLVVEPDEVRCELVGKRRPRVLVCEHVAAACVDLVGERQHHRLAGDNALQFLRAEKEPGHAA